MSLLTRARDDEGVALIAVIGLAVVMLLMVAMSLSFSSSGMVKARTDQNSVAALAAAYAGVDEYASRLSNDSTYQRFGNKLAPFTDKTGSAATVDLPFVENPAFGVGPGGSWATLTGASGRASFRYEIDNSTYSKMGVIRVRSTGKVGAETRSVVANLKQQGFLRYVYLTDYELSDKDVTGVACPVSYAPHDPSCGEIEFGSSDRIDGPVHSNDQVRVCGATFTGIVTTNSKLTPNYVDCGYATTTWVAPKPGNTPGPEFKDYEPLPLTSATMANETRADSVQAGITRPGCMYTGPTSITFQADGTMRVVSPWTKFTRPNLTVPTASENPAACGALSALNSTAGALVTVPDQNLIFVQDAQAGSTDPNYWPSTGTSSTPAGVTCIGGNGIGQGWRFGTTQYPLLNEVLPPTMTATYSPYHCRRGDAFVKGNVKGAVTVAAQSFVYVTGDLKYVDRNSDVLGLVGQNAVWVWNPMKSCTGTTNDGPPVLFRTCTPVPVAEGGAPTGNREIHAAILSVGHTFAVQNYDARGVISGSGKRGTLKVLGSIAQKFRGTVARAMGTSNQSGYGKDYVYDKRFASIAPPKFLAPMSSTYTVTQYVDVPTGFAASGAEIP